jgi:hypothetical protein
LSQPVEHPRVQVETAQIQGCDKDPPMAPSPRAYPRSSVAK